MKIRGEKKTNNQNTTNLLQKVTYNFQFISYI